MAAAQPKRRWLIFSLRTLFVLVSALGVWLGFQTQAARQQKQAGEAIYNAGGQLFYDDGAARSINPSARVSASPTSFDWLQQQIGEDYFRTAVAVSLIAKRKDSKATIDQFASLPHLKEILLYGKELDDEQLDALSELQELVRLQLDAPNVKGEFLSRLPHPERFKILELGGAKINDAALEPIANMSRLIILSLSRTPITDAGLAHLRNLKNLERLSLRSTGITDAGLQQLANLKQLTSLDIRSTRVSEIGVRKLQTALPGCKIIVDKNLFVGP